MISRGGGDRRCQCERQSGQIVGVPSAGTGVLVQPGQGGQIRMGIGHPGTPGVGLSVGSELGVGSSSVAEAVGVGSAVWVGGSAVVATGVGCGVREGGSGVDAVRTAPSSSKRGRWSGAAEGAIPRSQAILLLTHSGTPPCASGRFVPLTERSSQRTRPPPNSLLRRQREGGRAVGRDASPRSAPPAFRPCHPRPRMQLGRPARRHPALPDAPPRQTAQGTGHPALRAISR